MAKEELLAYRFTRDLATTHQIKDELYQQAVTTFGEKGVTDMLVLSDKYMIISSMLNTFSVPAPIAGKENNNQIHKGTDSASLPFWMNIPTRTSRRGNFWVQGERTTMEGKTYQRVPLCVTWEAPERSKHPHPTVLIQGGATQATEWLDTPDGRPGWAQRLVEAGYVVFTVDRSTQGRSPYHPDIVGKMGPAF